MTLGSRRFFITLLFLLAAGMVLGWNMAVIPLFEPDEGRYADMALTMAKTGDWIIPRMNYLVHLHKPPLSSWLVATSFKLLGPTEWTARFPNFLFSLGALFLVIRLGNLLFDFKTGIYAACILLNAPLYVVVSRIVTPDMQLAFFNILAAFSIAHLFFDDPHPSLSLEGRGSNLIPLPLWERVGVRVNGKLLYFYLAAFAIGLGMLTKGPVAWMMSLLPALIFILWKKKKLEISAKHWWLAVVIMVAISISWFLLVAIQKPGTLDFFLRGQLLARMFKGGAGHRYPIFYYLIVLPIGFLPWTLFLPSALTRAFNKEGKPQELKDKAHFLLTWFLVPFILFSIFKSKLATYIVPLFPFLSLLLAYYWKEFSEGKIPVTRAFAVVSWVLSSIYLVLLIAGLVFIKLRPEFIGGIPPAYIFGGAILMLVAWISMSAVLLMKKHPWIFPLQVAISVAISLATLTALPHIKYKNAKVFVEKIQELRKPGDIVMMYERYFASLPFYLGERVLNIGGQTEAGGRFETDPLLPKFYIDAEDRIKEFIEGPNRIFALTDEEGFETAKKFSPFPLYVLFEQQGYILFSNRAR